jgi:hypothetical protein
MIKFGFMGISERNSGLSILRLSITDGVGGGSTQERKGLPENHVVKVSTSTFIAGELGVISKNVIPEGKILFTIHGPIVSEPTKYTFQVGPSSHIDPITDDNNPGFGHYTNHSCDPSGALRIIQDGARRKIEMVALRALQPGNEITFDYATTEFDPVANGSRCKCGASNCRGVLMGYKDLPLSIKREYIKRGLVPDYLIMMDQVNNT